MLILLLFCCVTRNHRTTRWLFFLKYVLFIQCLLYLSSFSVLYILCFSSAVFKINTLLNLIFCWWQCSKPRYQWFEGQSTLWRSQHLMDNNMTWKCTKLQCTTIQRKSAKTKTETLMFIINWGILSVLESWNKWHWMLG